MRVDRTSRVAQKNQPTTHWKASFQRSRKVDHNTERMPGSSNSRRDSFERFEIMGLVRLLSVFVTGLEKHDHVNAAGMELDVVEDGKERFELV